GQAANELGDRVVRRPRGIGDRGMDGQADVRMLGELTRLPSRRTGQRADGDGTGRRDEPGESEPAPVRSPPNHTPFSHAARSRSTTGRSDPAPAPSSARAPNARALATAKLTPCRFFDGGTPGISRGRPEARTTTVPSTSARRYRSRGQLQSTCTGTTPAMLPG